MFKVLILRPLILSFFFYFKQKTAYEMRISDWSSDVCSSDLGANRATAELDGVAGSACRADAADHVQDQVLGRYARRQCSLNAHEHEIGRASGRERGCQYVYIVVVACSLKKKKR